MNYAVFTDFARWDEVNRRPYAGRDTTTRQLLTVFKHPDRNEWLVQIPANSLPKVSRYLTAQEQSDFYDMLTQSYPNDWPALDNLSPIPA
jgi:hypothetical protein